MTNIITMTLKNKTTTLKNLIKMREMTLNDPKSHIKKSLDTLKGVGHIYVWCYGTYWNEERPETTSNDLKQPTTNNKRPETT